MTRRPTEFAARDVRHDQGQMPPRAAASIDVRMRPECGTLIDVRPNEFGNIDDARLQALELQLRELTDDPTSGDIVIGVARGAVMTAGFMSLLAMIRPQLACQNRKLSLRGLRPECAVVLQESGLEDLVAGAVHQPAAEAATMVLFDCALTARSRGSERAA
jgi:hypothetical protein